VTFIAIGGSISSITGEFFVRFVEHVRGTFEQVSAGAYGCGGDTGERIPAAVFNNDRFDIITDPSVSRRKRENANSPAEILWINL
jgi:hypothetical protein